MTVIGIDPSLTATGLASEFGTSTIKAGDGDPRLLGIHDVVDKILAGLDVTLAVVEDLPTHAHGAGKTGMAQGVVRLALLQHGTPYVLVIPSTLKKFATGNGNCSKPDMRMALYKRFGLDIGDDNQVDAYWLRAMGLARLGDAGYDLPKKQLAALDVVKGWPA